MDTAAALHAHEHRAILGAQGRKQHLAGGRCRGADDDLLARAGMARRGEPATVVRVHGDFHRPVWSASHAQDPRCEARDIDAQPARAAGGARQLAVFGALPAVGRQASRRRRSGGGVAAVVEGDGLLRVRAPLSSHSARATSAALRFTPRSTASPASAPRWSHGKVHLSLVTHSSRPNLEAPSMQRRRLGRPRYCRSASNPAS